MSTYQAENLPASAEIDALIAETASTEHSPSSCKDLLNRCDEYLDKCFEGGASGVELVTRRAQVADAILRRIWLTCIPTEQQQNGTLLAVGGYGRGELHPCSDIDITVVTHNLGEDGTIDDEALQKFVTMLWDIGMEVGSSVRTLAQTSEAAHDDVTIMTNLLETRFLSGNEGLYKSTCDLIHNGNCWPSYSFFRAKFKEQDARNERFHDSAYRLEPNVKESPGGLRDLQTIGWVVYRHFGVAHLSELSDHEFLTDEEVQALRESRDFLWRVRFWLHRTTKRAEDRLLFEHQRGLAKAFGHHSDDGNAAVEQFMQRYYRIVTETVRLNKMLLQLFKERIVEKHEEADVQPINERFELINNYIAAKEDNVFINHPPALIEIFLVGCQRDDVEGYRAATVRLIRQSLHLIDDDFRNDETVQQLFLDIFKQPHGLTHQLSRMNRLGVLAAYMPSFQSIVGRMQFDLFHLYTVDEHTLKVVRNLRQFAVEEHAETHPDCTKIFPEIRHPYVLYVMGLMHDIAKGRGGDHCILGAEDMRIFAEQHGMPKSHSDLAAWGVLHHLTMSTVAQRRDIYDPQVIREFAEECKTVTRLNYLYLLTVADICGTDPGLWTDWKSNLLRTLYQSTRAMIEHGLQEAEVTKAEHIGERKAEALTLLEHANIADEDVSAFWNSVGEDYFLRYTPDEIAWHTSELASELSDEQSRTLIRTNSAGSTELVVYERDHSMLFANITMRIAQLGLDIVDARIVTTNAGFAIDTFTLLDESGEALSDPLRIEKLQQLVKQHDQTAEPNFRPPARRMRSFQIEPEIEFNTEDAGNLTSMLVTATDNPGLLSTIAATLNAHGLILHAAKISTFGEKVEDVFYISDENGEAIDSTRTLKKLHNTLIERLTEE